MDARTAIAVVSLLLLLAVGIPLLGTGSSTPTSGTHRIRRGSEVWSRFTPDTGGYWVELPGSAALRNRPYGLPDDDVPGTTHAAYLPESIYSVTAWSAPVTRMPEELLAERSRLLADDPDLLVEESGPLRHQGLPGLALRLRGTRPGHPLELHARFLAAGGRTFLLLVAGDPSAVEEQDVRRFFSSFRPR